MEKKILIAIIIFSGLIFTVGAMQYNKVQTLKCIGENSQLLVQPGSKICQEQIEMIGDDIKYLNVINCFSEREKCLDIDISKTPVWIIKKENNYKVYDTNKLKEITGC